MFRIIAAIGLAAAFALPSGTAFAEQGDSSSWGTVGWGPVIPTQELTPKDREWNSTIRLSIRLETAPNGSASMGSTRFPFSEAAEGFSSNCAGATDLKV